MFGNNHRVNPLESRKQLLIAESELNRAQLAGDWAAITAGIRTVTDRARSFGSIASSAAVLAAGLAALRRGKSVDINAKSSWLKTILKGASLVSTLWLALRAKRQNQETSSRDRSNRRSFPQDANHQEQVRQNKKKL